MWEWPQAVAAGAFGCLLTSDGSGSRESRKQCLNNLLLIPLFIQFGTPAPGQYCPPSRWLFPLLENLSGKGLTGTPQVYCLETFKSSEVDRRE